MSHKSRESMKKATKLNEKNKGKGEKVTTIKELFINPFSQDLDKDKLVDLSSRRSLRPQVTEQLL